MDREFTNNIVAIDPSLCSTGWAVLNQERELIECGTIKTKKLRGIDRIDYIVSEILGIVLSAFSGREQDTPMLVFIENYPFGIGKLAQSGRIFDLAELGGTIKYVLWKEHNIITIPIATSTAKKAATGKGNAKKEDVSRFVISRYVTVLGLGDRKVSLDETDAIAVGLAGWEWMRDPEKLATVTGDQ